MTDDKATPRAPKALKLALPSIAVAGGIGLADWARRAFQRKQVFLPDRYPSGVWEPAGFGVDAQDVWFDSEDGTHLHGWFVPHSRPRGTLLYCHGNSGSLAHQIGVLRTMRRLKVNLFAFDYRGYGRSAGAPTEQGVYQDARAAHDHLVRDLGVDPESIVLFGHSLGGAVAIETAGHRPVAGLVVQSSFTDIRSMARVFYPQFPMHWVARNQFRSIEKVEQLAMPKLFIHGTEDGTIPYRLGEELFERAAEPKQFLPIRRAGHNDVHQIGGLGYLRKVSRFVRACLRSR